MALRGPCIFVCILSENSHKLIVNLTLEIQNFYTVMYWIFVINPEHMKVFAWLLIHVIRPFISILTDFVTSHKIVFYSKLYDIDLHENCTHDRTYITLYVHEFVLSLCQHCFLDKKAPRTTLNCNQELCLISRLDIWYTCNSSYDHNYVLLTLQYVLNVHYICFKLHIQIGHCSW